MDTTVAPSFLLDVPGEPRSLRELFQESVRRHAARPAVRARVGSSQKSLTYADLGREIANVSVGLARLGLRPGDRVALVVENGIEWVVSWYAAVLAGAVVVPIYGELGPHEINNVVRQSDSRFAVVGARYAAKLDPRPLESVIVAGQAGRDGEGIDAVVGRMDSKGVPFSALSDGVTGEDRDRFRVDLRPGDLAAIIYTSGTLGDPKGVMLSHRNYVSQAIAGTPVGGYRSTDRLLLVLPLHHAFPFSAGLLAPLHNGCEVVFENDLRRIRDRMSEVKPTIFFGVPALYQTLYRSIVARLESEGKLEVFRKAERISADVKRRTGVNVGGLIFRELHQKLGGKLRYFGTGGAAISADLVRRFAVLGIPMMQGWGLTEASPVVAGQRLSKRRFLFTNYYERMAGSVGAPLPGVRVVCADVPDKRIYVGIHGEGELLVHGPNVMKGYYRNESATAETILDDWLRTGDVGRIDREGNVWLTGRAKSVIVLDSGEKVYPDEIEEHFESTAVVKDVCVIGRRPIRLIGDRKTQVCAVIYPDPVALENRARETGERLTADVVRRWIQHEVDEVQGRLAAYKRISEVVLTDTPLPRTDLRKVKRGSIREHYSFDLDKLLAGAEEI